MIRKFSQFFICKQNKLAPEAGVHLDIVLQWSLYNWNNGKMERLCNCNKIASTEV